jgi:hypothetical protein
LGCCTILLKPHIFCSMFIEKIVQFSRRQFSSIAQYRSEVTVTVTSSSSKRYGPYTPNSTQLSNDTVPTSVPHPISSYAAPKSGSYFCRIV